QQKARHRVALLTDGSESLPTSAAILPGIQPEIAHHLLAPAEALHRPDRQHEHQGGHRPHPPVVPSSSRRQGVPQLLWLRLNPIPPAQDPAGPVCPAAPAVGDLPMDLTPELLVLSVPQRPTTPFSGRRPGPWPAHATGFAPMFVGKLICDDVATAVADHAPRPRESRSAEIGWPAADRGYAEHPAHPSSASAPSLRGSQPHPLPKARVPAWLASARTIARSRLLPCPHALASATRRRTSAPHRSCGRVGVR